MSKKNIKQIALEFIAIAGAAPIVSFGQTPFSNTAPISNLSGLTTTVTTVVTWMVGIFWILTVAFVIWAAFLYLTAGGDEEKVKEAKSRIIYAVIAAAVALLATGLSSIATNVLKGSL